MIIQPARLWRYSLPAALALLVPVSLLPSLGMDIYLPVVPAMPAIFGTTPDVIQLTLTLYMIVLGVGQVLFGPISDRLGRRPVLLFGLAVFAAASFGLARVDSAAALVLLRVVQGLGASALLVAVFATIRDVYAGRPESGAVYSLMNATLSFVPALGPILGALIAEALGWRAIFVALGLMAVAMAVPVLPAWHETRPDTRGRTGGGWSAILSSGPFWAYTLAFATAMGGFFVFFSTAPRVLIGRGGMGEFGFSLAFASVAVVMIGTSRAAPGLAQRYGLRRCAIRGLGVMALGAGLMLPGQWLLPPSVLSFAVPMGVIAVGIVMIGAVAANGALAGFEDRAGMAVALHFCVQSLIVGVIGTGCVVLLRGDTAYPVIGYVAGMGLITRLAFGSHDPKPGRRA